MRQEIFTIYVEKKEMETIKSCDYCEISYIKRSDELPVKKVILSFLQMVKANL